jgi:prepilin-type N-terminal cleavage/methylation domain-containing protein
MADVRGIYMKFLKSQNGMTVIEIIVALGILGIVVVGVMGFFTDSFKYQARNQQSVKAQKLVYEAMEELKSTKYIDNTYITQFDAGEDIPLEISEKYDIEINVVDIIDEELGTILYDVIIRAK